MSTASFKDPLALAPFVYDGAGGEVVFVHRSRIETTYETAVD